MEAKFKETMIPEDFSKAMAEQSFVIGPTNIPRVATVLFHGTSCMLGSIKDMNTAKAIVFKDAGNNFLAAAKIEYIPNSEQEDNSLGQWSYTWTFYESDVADCECIDATNNNILSIYYTSSGQSLYNLRFASPDLSILMMIILLEMIISWLRENTSETKELTVLELEGVFKATSELNEDGSIEMGLVPDGEMKVLVKDDSKIQEC